MNGFSRIWQPPNLGRFARVVLITLGVCLFLLVVVLPSHIRSSHSNAISDALRGIRSVTVIEFVRSRDGGQEIALRVVTLSQEQISALEATGGFLDFGWPMSSLCFEPHHRIHVQREDGEIFDLDVCFLCSNFRMTGRGIQNLPTAWGRRLEQFFTSLEMPPRTDDEYSKLTPKRPVTNRNATDFQAATSTLK